MRTAPGTLLVAVGLAFAVGGASCSKEFAGSDGGGGGSDGATGSTLACTVATDCTRTEIDHEILARADCICLLGCPFNIVNVTTANRRMAQYQMVCTPGQNAQGQPCPIDDCALPPPLACTDQVCVTAPAASF
jgi:hypothetical protein